MAESKQIFYSVIAGLLTGIIASIIIAIRINGMFASFIQDLVYHQLLAQGISSSKALEIAEQTAESIGSLTWLFYVGPIINMLFLGAILGIVLDLLVKKVKLNPSIASIITGLILIFLLQLLPIYALNSLYGQWFIDIFNKYISLWIILTPSIIYTFLLTLFNTIRGPWIKWGEAKPEKY